MIAATSAFVAANTAQAQKVAPEAGIDLIFSGVEAIHARLGVMVPAGTYLRAGLVGGLGSSRDGLSGRIDVVGRFHLDPFRESRWAPYAGGGLTTRFDEGSKARGYLLIVFGIDGPSSGGMTTSVEAGLGGGGRIGIFIRRANAERR